MVAALAVFAFPLAIWLRYARQVNGAGGLIIAIGAAVVLAAPFTLINPERTYNDLLTTSLVALWLSQLIVFAAYPRFAVYGLWATIQHSGT
jgi:hypothetical protein